MRSRYSQRSQANENEIMMNRVRGYFIINRIVAANTNYRNTLTHASAFGFVVSLLCFFAMANLRRFGGSCGSLLLKAK